MKLVKNLLKLIVYILALPAIYILISLILTGITVNSEQQLVAYKNKSIYISTNGVHLDIILSKDNLEPSLIAGLKRDLEDHYFAFGWGDENFYLNTPTWADLTVKNALCAVFFKSPSLVHISRHSNIQTDWVKIPVTEKELRELNAYLFNTFLLDKKGKKMILKNMGYSDKDDFYKAVGNYSLIKTCNSWANSALKESGIKACLWTPFDFGLINKHH